MMEKARTFILSVTPALRGGLVARAASRPEFYWHAEHARVSWIHMTAGRPSGSPRKAGMTSVVVAALLFASSIPAHADITPQQTLMIANVAGECDVLVSMIDFQKKNDLKGGEEYVARFWADRAAKENLTVEQLSDRCRKSSAAFDKLWSSFTPNQQGAASGNE